MLLAGAKLDGQSKRLIDRLVKNGLRSGLHLEESVRNEIKAIKKRLSDISIDFQKNVNDENTTFLLTDEQLKGHFSFLSPFLKQVSEFNVLEKYGVIG